MTTPQVNVNVDSTRFRNALEKAYPGALASDNPLAPLYNKQTFGGNDLVEAQHVIPVSVANDPNNVRFFQELRTGTEKSPGGAYVFKLNDVQNGIFLPTSSAAAATGQQKGVYAAVYYAGNKVQGIKRPGLDKIKAFN